MGGIHRCSFSAKTSIHRLVGADDLDDWEGELQGEFMVALIVRRNGHDGPRAVAGEDIVGDPDRDLLPVDGIDGIGTGEDAGLFLGEIGALEIALGIDGLHVGLDCRALSLGGDLCDQRMLRGKYEVGRAEEGVGSRREDGDGVAFFFEAESHLGSLAATDPVALQDLDGFRPVELFQISHQALGVGRDAEHPLAHRATFHGEAPDLALPIDDFLVGEHRA